MKYEEKFIQFPNTTKRVGKTRCNQALLTNFEVFLKSDEMLFRVFDRPSQTINKSWRNSKQKLTKVCDN